MSTRTTRLALIALPVAAALLAAAATTPAYAQPAGTHTATRSASVTEGPHASRVGSLTDGLARSLAHAFTNRSLARSVSTKVAAGSVDLLTIDPHSAFGRAAAKANAAVLAAKGLPATSGSVLQLRLGDPSMKAALAKGVAPVVAATPSSDKATSVNAYTAAGKTVVLSTAVVPKTPVLVVDVDTAKAASIGLPLMRKMFTKAGVQHQNAAPSTSGIKPADAGGYWTTKIDAVWLSNDEETWIEGAAEIYSIVGGFDLTGAATVNIVQQPYLDYDHHTYYPNQILVSYNNYKYNLADVVMMEDDGDTNYQSLAEAITTALLTITDQGTYIPLVDPILNAIPSSWWTNDPDYVDSWYTLSTTTSGTIYGAAGNGWMTVEPYWVQAF